MSNRHRASRSAAPGATHAAPTKDERRASNRRARHKTHELLARVDEDTADAVVTPQPRHETVDLDPSEVDKGAKSRANGRDDRHWKQKFWKRRSNERARKAELATNPD
jgi:hypothetical protein